MHPKISGTGVALVTPFNSDLSIDYNGLAALVNHCVDGNVDFLVVMGTTGESVTLSLEEKNTVLDCVKKANNNRLPIVLGIGGNNTDNVIQSFSSFDLSGVDAILSVSPKHLWLRNNASTFSSQLVDTATVLLLLCVAGAIAWDKFWILLLNGFLFKVIMALIDTPILYIVIGLIRKKLNLKVGEEVEI